MTQPSVVVCLVRNQSSMVRAKPQPGNESDGWGLLVAVGTTDPSAVFERFPGLAELTTHVRAGDPVEVDDGPSGGPATIHPHLYDCEQRSLQLPGGQPYRWDSPVAVRSTADSHWFWRAYERVWPTPATIAADESHGASYLSVRALEVLRDRVANGAEREPLLESASQLLAARPSMAVVRNRINRVMATDRPVESVISEEIDRAHTLDEQTAVAAASIVDAQSVLTLSRSGTVEKWRAQWSGTLFVLESRPGGEGTAVAASLDGQVLPDAAAAYALAGPIDAVVVGADTVYPDGSIVNKLGTRGVARIATAESVPVYVLATSDKITHQSPSADDAPLSGTSVPTFDRTPGGCVRLITESGLQSATDIAAIADQHAELSDWNASDEHVT